MIRLLVAFAVCACLCRPAWSAVPDDFPTFRVPGHQPRMDRLGELFYLHYQPARPLATLWDPWLPTSTLWPVVKDGNKAQTLRNQWRAALLGRKIDAEGYVSTHQHRGLAHNDGWPFPLWTQSGGIGWQFSLRGMPFGRELNVVQTKTLDAWKLEGVESAGIDDDAGWQIRLVEPAASVATPTFEVDPIVAPFIRLAWRARGLPANSQPYVEWTTQQRPDFAPERRMYFSPATDPDRIVYTHVPVYRHPRWKGRITRLRLNFDNRPGAEVTVRSLITAVDSRHNINNSNFIKGSCDYFDWTGDVAFLRENVGRMRLALRFAMSEFDTRREKCVVTPWVGHGGRTAIEFDAQGGKIVHPGRGVGNNYWDLMPFGGKDALATIYYFHAVRRLAELERQIDRHPQWNVPAGPLRFDAGDLDRHADEVRSYAGKMFWNERTGRFVGAIDLDGNAHDYGFTFVNCEAVYYDFATHEQARSIVDWLTGKRVVQGDTSQGDDIYHWRFAPRSTTRRNVDYYVWAWCNPESIPWGDQVQDGGAVLGFSYFDLMARLETNGPDDAWGRLAAIIDWFSEVQQAGGYRTYYSQPGRGRLQGGGTPGGLGLDREFFESVMVPQVMLYGFLGFEPRADGFALDPRLPTDWPELQIDRIGFHDLQLAVSARTGEIVIRGEGPQREQLSVYPPKGGWTVELLDEKGQPEGPPQEVSLQPEGPARFPLPLQTSWSIRLRAK